MIDERFTLNDGRILAFRKYGDINGVPILYFTGGQSSRFDGEQFEAVLKKVGVCLYTFDRPGTGESTISPTRTLLDWADDVHEFCIHKNLNKVSVFGLSGGGPHVLALAYKYPNLVNKVSLISSSSPWGYRGRYRKLWFPIKVIYFIAKHKPSMMKSILEYQRRSLEDVEKFEKQMSQSLPKPDKELFLKNANILQTFRKSSVEAYKNGIDGDLIEWQLYVNDWGFLLKDIKQHINLWYGLYDKQAPYYMGEYLDKNLSNSTLRIVEDGGHLSTINNHIELILKQLI